MAALDATAFQERVLRVVGDNNIDRARTILTKLDELDSQASPLQPADGGGLPIGTLALQLDRVKLATADLARFNDALLPPSAIPADGEASAAAGNGDAIEGPTLAELLRGLGTDLQSEFNDLNATLE